MTSAAKSKAEKLKELRSQGLTLKESGAFFGISKERARQLIAQYDRIYLKS